MVSTNPGFLSTWKLSCKRPHFQAHIPHKGQVPTERKPEEISAFITNPPGWMTANSQAQVDLSLLEIM